MTNKYDVNPDLKTILTEGKTSTFSLTNLFDSNNLKKEDANQNDNLDEDDLNDDDEKRLEEESVFSKFVDRKRHHYASEGESEDELNESDDHNKQTKDQYQVTKEQFFFGVNDDRFERLKFYDSNKVDRHNQDWTKKKQQLSQVT